MQPLGYLPRLSQVIHHLLIPVLARDTGDILTVLPLWPAGFVLFISILLRLFSGLAQIAYKNNNPAVCLLVSFVLRLPGTSGKIQSWSFWVYFPCHILGTSFHLLFVIPLHIYPKFYGFRPLFPSKTLDFIGFLTWYYFQQNTPVFRVVLSAILRVVIWVVNPAILSGLLAGLFRDYHHSVEFSTMIGFDTRGLLCYNLNQR